MDFKEEQNIENEIIDQALNIFIKETKIPIGLFDEESCYFSVRSRGVFSGFCKNITGDKNLQHLCEDDHKRRGLGAFENKIEKCHVGLWNAAFPIYIKDDSTKIKVATLLCGQRLIKGREKDSLEVFNEFLVANNIVGEKEKKLKKDFGNLENIEESVFKNDVFNNLIEISKLIY